MISLAMASRARGSEEKAGSRAEERLQNADVRDRGKRDGRRPSHAICVRDDRLKLVFRVSRQLRQILYFFLLFVFSFSLSGKAI